MEAIGFDDIPEGLSRVRAGTVVGRLVAHGRVLIRDEWSPPRPWDEAERVTGRVGIDVAVEVPGSEGQYAGPGGIGPGGRAVIRGELESQA